MDASDGCVGAVEDDVLGLLNVDARALEPIEDASEDADMRTPIARPLLVLPLHPTSVTGKPALRMSSQSGRRSNGEPS